MCVLIRLFQSELPFLACFICWWCSFMPKAAKSILGLFSIEIEVYLILICFCRWRYRVETCTQGRRKAPKSCAAVRGGIWILSAVPGAPAARCGRAGVALDPDNEKPHQIGGAVVLLFCRCKRQDNERGKQDTKQEHYFSPAFLIGSR